MNKTVKATLWIFGVFAALSLGVYFAGCSSDSAADGGVVAETGCKAAGDACTGGKCFAETGGTFACYKECTTVGDACDTGTCYFLGPDANAFFCGTTGSKAVGDPCGAATECVAGAQCLDQGGTMNCYQVCTDTCDTGDCTDTSLGFKVCVAAATEG